MSGVTNVSAVQGAPSVPEANSPQGKGGSKPVPVNQGKTEAYLATEKKLERAKYTLEVLKVQVKDPDISTEKQKELQAKIDKLQNVYNKVTPKINDDGSVTFEFKGEVNVEDFKEAFGLKEGTLRAHLSARHKIGVEEGYTNIIDAEIYKGGQKYTEDHYNNNSGMAFDGGILTDPQDKMTVSFNQSEAGSYLKYSDGCVLRVVKKFWGGSGFQMDYSEMTLRPGDSKTLSLSGSSFKDD